MSQSEINNYRNMTEAELNQQLVDLERQLFEFRFNKSTHKPVTPSQKGALRHQVAQIQTVLSEKRRAEALA